MATLTHADDGRPRRRLVVGAAAAIVGLVGGAGVLVAALGDADDTVTGGSTVGAVSSTSGRTTTEREPVESSVPTVSSGATTISAPSTIPSAAQKLDLTTGSLFSLVPYLDRDAESVVDEVNGHVGQPTSDTGWTTVPADPAPDGADCYAGLGLRIVQWGDTSMSFFRFSDGSERFWRWTVGATTDADPRLQAPDPGTALGVTSEDGLAVGSTIDDLTAAGYEVGLTVGANVGGYEPGGTVADPRDATVAGIQVGQSVPLLIRLSDGVVIGMEMSNEGGC